MIFILLVGCGCGCLPFFKIRMQVCAWSKSKPGETCQGGDGGKGLNPNYSSSVSQPTHSGKHQGKQSVIYRALCTTHSWFQRDARHNSLPDTAVLLSSVTLGIDGLLVLSSTSDLMILGTCPNPIKVNRNAKNSLALSQTLYDSGQEQLEIFNLSRRRVNGNLP